MSAAATPRRWPLLIAAACALAILLSLGTWQVNRLQWKEGLLASIAERTRHAPLPLSGIEAAQAAGNDFEYTPVTATGTFAHEGERFYFDTWKGASGYHVYTPLQLADGRFLFVNRGFVPFDMRDPAKRAAGEIVGEVTVTGLARSAPAAKAGWVVPENDIAKNVFYWKDLKAMTSSAGLPADAKVLPFFVDANDAPNPGGLPVGGVTNIQLPNNHLQYAFTWYGLALALVGVVIVWLRRPASQTNPTRQAKS